MQANALSTSACLLQTRQSESLCLLLDSANPTDWKGKGGRKDLQAPETTAATTTTTTWAYFSSVRPSSLQERTEEENGSRPFAPLPPSCIVVQKKTKLRTGDFSRLGSSYEVKHQYIAHSPNSFASFARYSRQEISDMRGRQRFFYTEVKHFLSLLFLNEYFAEPDRRSLSYTYLRVSIYSSSALL